MDTANTPVWTLTFTLKALDEQIEAALDIFTDILFELDPNDEPRLQQVLFQAMEEYRSYFIQEGLRAASIHAGRGLTPETEVLNILYGTSQYSLLKNAAEKFEQTKQHVVENLQKIHMANGQLACRFSQS